MGDGISVVGITQSYTWVKFTQNPTHTYKHTEPMSIYLF